MSQFKEIIVKVKVPSDAMVSLKVKEKMLLAFSDLPAEDQENMTQIMKNQNMLKAIKENKEMLLSMYS